MPRINSVKQRQLTATAPDQSKELVVARLGSLPVVTYSVAGATGNIDEGAELTVNVTTVNVRDGTVLRWRIIDRPGDFAVITGVVTVASNTASLTVSPTADLLLEGAETFRIQLEKFMGTVLAVSDPITINDTSAATLTVTPSSLSINEGDTLTIDITVDTQDIPDGFVLYWASSRPTDLNPGSGSFVINNDSASFNTSVIEDFLTEGAETLTITILSGSVDGVVIATSPEIIINDTSVETYAVTPAASSVNEGDTLSLSVSTQGVPNGTALYWSVSRPGDFLVPSGSLVINNDTGGFSVTTAPDTISEPTETFSVDIMTGSTSGAVVATSSSITINNALYSITPATNAIDEGSALSFTVETTNVNNGTALYWTTSSGSDFSNPSGAFTIDSNTGNFSVTAIADELTEGIETFTVSVRRYSISGPVVATSSAVTINDTSIGIAPSNTALPVIGGTALINQTLTTSNGTWTGAPTPTFSYQWQRGSTNISGATNSSYVIQAADGNNTLRCVVTASNATGSASATTASTVTVPIAPSIVSNPTISGTISIGQTITSSSGTWNGVPAPTFSYQWQRGTILRSNISGATNSSYVIQSSDGNSTLRCRVIAVNDGGSAVAFTADSVTVPAPPSNSVAPTVSGAAYVGETLTVSDGIWLGTPTPTFAYQWQRGTNNISGATSNSYIVTTSDLNNTLRCRVTASNSQGSVQVNSANTATVSLTPTGQSYIIPGTYTWVAPANVTRVSVVAVGGGGGGGAAYWSGGGGGGGGLGWKNNIVVSPGSSYTVVVGAGGSSQTANEGGIGSAGQVSYFINTSTVRGGGGAGGQGTSTNTNTVYNGGAGGGYLGDGGGNGGNGGNSNNDTAGGGGGAGGYLGNGGNANTSGSGGGGGGGNNGGGNSSSGAAQSGGGVGIGGEGSSGSAGGGGGSGGTNGSSNNTAGGSDNTGGFYGGGGGGQSNDSKNTPGCHGASGAVRIIWGGSPALTYPVGQGTIQATAPQIRVFNYVTDSDQSFTVPTGVTSITAKLWGAGGGSNRDAGSGGAGGFTNTAVSVTPGEVLSVRVGRAGDGGGQGTSQTTSISSPSTRQIGGSGGWPGGGRGGNSSGYGAAGGGGGYTALLRGSTLLAVAGGGGGGGDDRSAGAGGGTSGQSESGGGGTQSAGGSSVLPVGLPSGFLQGASYSDQENGGGGGGGGYYGGGAGSTWSGGGGGSGYVTGTGSTFVGSGRTPPGTGDLDYGSLAGYGAPAGGTGEDINSTFIGLRGYNGRVVLRWDE